MKWRSRLSQHRPPTLAFWPFAAETRTGPRAILGILGTSERERPDESALLQAGRRTSPLGYWTLTREMNVFLEMQFIDQKRRALAAILVCLERRQPICRRSSMLLCMSVLEGYV